MFTRKNYFETIKVMPLVQKLRSSFGEDSVDDTDFYKLVSDFPTQTDILKYFHRIGQGLFKLTGSGPEVHF